LENLLAFERTRVGRVSLDLGGGGGRAPPTTDATKGGGLTQGLRREVQVSPGTCSQVALLWGERGNPNMGSTNT